MSDQVKRWPVAGFVLVVSLGVVLLVLLQGGELGVPAHCVAKRCATVLRRVAGERSTILGYAWIAAGLVAVMGAAVCWLVLRSRPRRDGVGALQRDRAVLVQACVNVSDVEVSEALREQLIDALADAGVEPVDVAAGMPFDPSRHRAVGRAFTTDASRHNRVASTERYGYVDRGKRLRYPDVVVFNANGGSRS